MFFDKIKQDAEAIVEAGFLLNNLHAAKSKAGNGKAAELDKKINELKSRINKMLHNLKASINKQESMLK